MCICSKSGLHIVLLLGRGIIGYDSKLPINTSEVGSCNQCDFRFDLFLVLVFWLFFSFYFRFSSR